MEDWKITLNPPKYKLDFLKKLILMKICMKIMFFHHSGHLSVLQIINFDAHYKNL